MKRITTTKLMKQFFKRLSLKLLIIIFVCFFLTNFSWALPDGFSQLKNDKSLNTDKQITFEKDGLWWAKDAETIIPDTQITSREEESLACEQKIPSEKKEFLTRGQKTLLLNAGSWATIVGFGIKDWEYGKSKFHFKSEGWFGRETPYGGVDKLSHAWSGYVMSHLFSYAYRKWEYTDKEANLYGVLSSLGVNAFMELADGFSPSEGFSYEDMTMNILGSGLGYILREYPSLASKIDFRLEFTPKFDSDDLKIGTSYERYRYLIAVKADGFDFIKNPYLQYLELHLGYNARGYDDYKKDGPDDRHRRIYAGIGFNVSKLLQKYMNTAVLDYIQLPYTSLRKDFPLD
jgi:hypothetical protein